MGSNGVGDISKGAKVEGPEPTIEINIKTLDSQTYTLQVNKQMPVPELKEQIASVTGVLSDQQRLICRGRVLRDDQLLSAYHVEDGHTLHLVSRLPASPGNLPVHPATDPIPSASHGQRIEVAPGVVVETFNITDHGDRGSPDINRIISAVLSAFGVNNAQSGVERVNGQAHERSVADHDTTTLTDLRLDLPATTSQFDRSHDTIGQPTSFSLGSLQPRVIPDSLTTLSQYLSHLQHVYNANGRRTLDSVSLSAQEGLPRPELLAEVLLHTREMLTEQLADCILQLGMQLRNQSSGTDAMGRNSTQSDAWAVGNLFQHLGAYMLELGRTTMTLRMGQNPSEAVVNSGPAVFISQFGPNPLMVQTLPFQTGASLGLTSSRTGERGFDLVNDISAGLVPSRIDVQIRRGPSAGGHNSNQEERAGSQQPSSQRNPSLNPASNSHATQVSSTVNEGPSTISESGVRLLPVRTMVASVPGSRLPVLERFHQVASGHLNDRREPQILSVRHLTGFQTGSEQVSGSGIQHNAAERASEYNSTNVAVEPGKSSVLTPAPNSRRFRLSVLSTGENVGDHLSQGQIPSEIYQLLRALSPGGEISSEDTVLPAAAAAPIGENMGANGIETDVPAEPVANDEGIFLSNLLHQIMPIISQGSGATTNVLSVPEHTSEQGTVNESSTEGESSSTGMPHRRSDVHTSAPNTKRQKTYAENLLHVINALPPHWIYYWAVFIFTFAELVLSKQGREWLSRDGLVSLILPFNDLMKSGTELQPLLSVMNML